MSQRLSIIDAAKALNVSVETIRRRIKARQVEFEKDNTGKYWIICDPPPPNVTKLPTPSLPSHDEADLRNQIRLLEDQLKASHEAHAADRALLHELVRKLADIAGEKQRSRKWWHLFG